MKAHLRESWGSKKASKHTCLGRTGASVTSPAHLHKNSSEVTNSGNYPTTRVVSPPVLSEHVLDIAAQRCGALRLLEAIRQFTAAWEQHMSFVPRSERPEERAARKAADDALTHVEDCAQWLQAEMKLEVDNARSD